MSVVAEHPKVTLAACVFWLLIAVAVGLAIGLLVLRPSGIDPSPHLVGQYRMPSPTPDRAP